MLIKFFFFIIFHTCFLVASADSAALVASLVKECPNNKNNPTNPNNKSTPPNTTNFLMSKKLPPHNKSERPSEKKLWRNTPTKEVTPKNSNKSPTPTMSSPTHKNDNFMISMVKRESKLEGPLGDPALICLISSRERNHLDPKKASPS